MLAGTILLISKVILLTFLIVGCVKKKMWLVSSMCIFYCCEFLFSKAIIIRRGIPDGFLIDGAVSNIPIIIIGCALLLLGSLTVIFRNSDNQYPVNNPSRLRWVWFSVGVLILMSGLIYFFMCVYTIIPTSSKLSTLHIGVYVNILSSFIGATILYFVSRLNSIQRANFMRWLVLYTGIYFIFTVMAASNLLLSAVPVQPKTVYPELSVLMTSSFVSYSLLLSGLTKDFAQIENKEINT